ncbi:hypothetical protein GEMRC1_004301 [Eukaryota sp. GEM-RC1]
MNCELERILKVFPEVLVYRPGARPSADGYIAGSWNENNFLTKGRLTVAAVGETAYVRIEDERTDELFAECPVTSDNFTKAVERVLDSSRYYVIKVVHEDKFAYLGMGFKQRNDSFEFMACLQDHLKHSRTPVSSIFTSSSRDLDLSLKEGQQININIPSKPKSTVVSPKSSVTDDFSFFPLVQSTRSRSDSSEVTKRKETKPTTEWEMF